MFPDGISSRLEQIDTACLYDCTLHVVFLVVSRSACMSSKVLRFSTLLGDQGVLYSNL